MANQKSDTDAARVPLNYRVRPAVKDAIDEMIRRRANAGKGSTGAAWFLELVYKEAASQGITIAPASVEPSPAPAGKPGDKRAAASRKKK